MKKAKKVLLLVLCAALLIAGSVMGTLAYLTSQKSIENTFTAGNVTITLQERDMDPATGALKTPAALVDEIKDIKVVPGRTVYKQPVVFVADGSEDCWLFVKVEGNLLTSGTFAVNSKWAPVDGQSGWYRYTDNEGKATYNAEGYQVFESFTFDALTNDQVLALQDGTIKVTAYAVQYELVDANAAWDTAKAMAESD